MHSVSPFFARARLLSVVDDLAKVVAALNLVLDLTEDLADLVFDSVRAGRLLPEAMQMGEELSVHEVPEIIAGGGLVVVEITVFSLGRGPNSQLIRLVEDVGVSFAFQRVFAAFVLLKIVQVFQEEQPGNLLGVIEFRRASSFFPKDILNVFKGLFEHGHPEHFSARFG